MAYNFDVKLPCDDFEIGIDTAAGYGYFEHNELGDECGGGLWFNETYADLSGSDPKLELTDYDGVMCLPGPVADALRAHGIIVDADFDEDLD